MPALNYTANSLAQDPKARDRFIASLTDEEALACLYEWKFWARPNQLPPPGAWVAWLLLAGRGFGKTRTGAETIRDWAESGRYKRLALVGPTSADVRDVMIEGESGIMAISPPWNRPIYEPSKRRLTWANGAQATAYSADEPDRLRGPQHDGAWCDELAAWNYPEAWDMLLFGLRLGDDPRVVVTTTPKPVPIIRELCATPTTVITSGKTSENVRNLAPAFLSAVVSKYKGTRLGRQELDAELLGDVEGALWRRDWIEAGRVTGKIPPMKRIVVAVDPPASSNGASALAGIVCAGLGVDDRGYVLADVSRRCTPGEWAKLAVDLYHAYDADRIVAEANQGGEMVRHTISTHEPNLPIRLVHASRGKQARAEPVAALSEQNRIGFCGAFPELEDQLCTWAPLDGQPSPDRLDAMVWAFTDLMIGQVERTLRVT